MHEEIIVSGKNIPHIQPVLELWGGPIALYLFFGGLAAGLILFSNFYYLRNKTEKLATAVKYAPAIAPVIIILGLVLLVFDLHHPLYFWQLLLHFRIDSPMSWGAWTLTVILVPGIFWPLSYIHDIIAHLEERIPDSMVTRWVKWFRDFIYKFKFMDFLIEFTVKNRKLTAYFSSLFAIILGVYTGILLSAFNARPLWNTAILGPLFLTSGLSTAAALIMWLSNNHKEIRFFSRVDLMLIAIELFLIIHMFMGMKAGGIAQVETAGLFLGGPYTAIFWIGVVGFGLLFPATLEIMELAGMKIPVWLPAFLILAGGLLFRFIMVYAGQFSSYHVI